MTRLQMATTIMTKASLAGYECFPLSDMVSYQLEAGSFGVPAAESEPFASARVFGPMESAPWFGGVIT